MRAAMIKAFGEPAEVLELVDVPEPAGPPAGEALVGVEYAPINMNDLYLIQGAFPVRPSLPSIVGNEGVGRVLAVGSGVEHLRVGDRVLIPLYAFSWRERLVVPAAGLFNLPDADPRQLAMLGINPPTASLLLDEASDLKPGDWVVQNAANSGVGCYLDVSDLEDRWISGAFLPGTIAICVGSSMISAWALALVHQHPTYSHPRPLVKRLHGLQSR